MLSMNERLQILTFENEELKAKLGSERRLFAAMAMQGLLSCSLAGGHRDTEGTAELAVNHAGALIDELNK